MRQTKKNRPKPVYPVVGALPRSVNVPVELGGGNDCIGLATERVVAPEHSADRMYTARRRIHRHTRSKPGAASCGVVGFHVAVCHCLELEARHLQHEGSRRRPFASAIVWRSAHGDGSPVFLGVLRFDVRRQMRTGA